MQGLDAENVPDGKEQCGDATCAVCFPGGKKGETVQPVLETLETLAVAEIPAHRYTIPTHVIEPVGKIRPIPKKRRARCSRGGRVFSQAKRGHVSRHNYQPRRG